MASYLIEFRFFGRTKHEIKNLIREVVHKGRLGRRRRPIPHITLVGPFCLRDPRDEEKLISDFEELCAKQPVMTFKIKGFGTFENTRVVYLNIVPDEALDKFRWEMSRRLQDYCTMSPYDLERKFNFHSTIVMKIKPNKLQEVKRFLETLPEPEFNHYVIRVTLIKNRKILREYDFLLRRSLTRREGKSRRILSETYKRLEECIRKEGLLLPESGPLVPIPELKLGEIKDGLFSRILDKIKPRKRRIFFIGDLHFNHANIIKYCNRPFRSVDEMNDFILNAWNTTVRKNDIVYFLGDLASGKTSYWLSQLNGKIIFIRGNHDKSRRIRFYDRLILNCEGQRFLLVHDPKDVPPNWKDWVIHGHTHNNKPEYPLIDKNKKTINISAELLGYKPISWEELRQLVGYPPYHSPRP